MPKKVKQGIVTSDKMNKTIVVEVAEHNPHKKYKKIMKTTKNYKAHDELNTAGVGDVVTIIESKPISSTVRWALKDIVEKAK
ncbi:MAG: 30S ribosomal protein S17 [Cyanobacteria bacterium SIG30]|nr:30S ribosomal protein S17 [Cyanobacteria bacterium SIG30]